ncbi:MAG: ATP-dependent RNA helicase RhlB [Chromatiales bacterium]|nr:ATP-dependent RNA helicase RhlB [Chromatiales bacterium]
MVDQHLSDVSFASLGLRPEILHGLADAGFDLCTPIQAESLPPALSGNDVAGQAQTGTGKTAAFLIASFQRLLTHAPPRTRRANQPRAIMLAPTRELAVQIHRDAEQLGRYTGLRLGLAFGGTDYEKQREELAAGVDILIGTPGRIIDYFKQRVFDLNAVQVMVLDEADRMFDLGFIKDIRFLLRRMPPPAQRLSLLFSATLSMRVTELAYEHMNNPVSVKIATDKVTADRVRQSLYLTANDEKLPLLIGLFRYMDPKRSIVFVNTKRAAELIGSALEANALHAAVLSGDVPQKKRLRLLRDFQTGELPVLVATDVAARGLHIPEVSHVFNFDLPQDAEDYVHRIGRTARLGASGDAISFACEDYSFHLPDIERYIGHKIEIAEMNPELLATDLEIPKRTHRPRSGPGGRPPRRGDRSRPPADGRPPRRRRRPRSGAPGSSGGSAA